MNNNFSRQLGVALRIWLLAICVNTITGTVILGFNDPSFIPLILVYGILLGGIYSLPVSILLLIVINRCVAKKVSGLFLYRLVFISGLVLSAGACFAFDRFTSILFLGLALLSAIVAIFFHRKALISLNTKEPYDDFLAGQASSQ